MIDTIENNVNEAYNFFYDNIQRLLQGGKISEAAANLQLHKLNLFIDSFNKLEKYTADLELENMELSIKYATEIIFLQNTIKAYEKAIEQMPTVYKPYEFVYNIEFPNTIKQGSLPIYLIYKDKFLQFYENQLISQ